MNYKIKLLVRLRRMVRGRFIIRVRFCMQDTVARAHTQPKISYLHACLD